MCLIHSVTNWVEGNKWDIKYFLPCAMKWLEYMLFLIDLKVDNASDYIESVCSFRLLKNDHEFNAKFIEKVI